MADKKQKRLVVMTYIKEKKNAINDLREDQEKLLNCHVNSDINYFN